MNVLILYNLSQNDITDLFTFNIEDADNYLDAYYLIKSAMESEHIISQLLKKKCIIDEMNEFGYKTPFEFSHTVFIDNILYYRFKHNISCDVVEYSFRTIIIQIIGTEKNYGKHKQYEDTINYKLICY